MVAALLRHNVIVLSSSTRATVILSSTSDRWPSGASWLPLSRVPWSAETLSCRCAMTPVLSMSQYPLIRRRDNCQGTQKLTFDTPVTYGRLHTGLFSNFFCSMHVGFYFFGPGRWVPKSHSSCCSYCCCYQFSKAFLIHSGVQRNFAYTFVLALPTDLPSQIFALIFS